MYLNSLTQLTYIPYLYSVIEGKNITNSLNPIAIGVGV